MFRRSLKIKTFHWIVCEFCSKNLSLDLHHLRFPLARSQCKSVVDAFQSDKSRAPTKITEKIQHQRKFLLQAVCCLNLDTKPADCREA